MTSLIFKTPPDKNYFFGYYDKSPLDVDSEKILAIEVDFINRLPTSKDVATIGYFNINDKNRIFIKLCQTNAFNWQQGCMLQWLGPDFKTKIIYNDIRDGKFVSIIFDIERKTEVILNFPVYSVLRSGLSALCIDFERHYYCRPGYNYQGIINRKKDKKIVENDGIWLLSLQDNTRKKIVDLKFLIENYYINNMENATHYLEHIMINLTGSRFAFLHRWQLEHGGIYDRLFTVNIDGSDLFLLNDSGRLGHYCWRNDQEILMYGGLKNSINGLRKKKIFLKYLFKPLLPFYHILIKDNSKISKVLTGDSYVILKDKGNIKIRIADEISTEDGHPSFSDLDTNTFITDTYPKKSNDHTATLLAYDIEKKKKIILAKLKSLRTHDETGWRCDLHPKWSYDGRFVAIDTMDSGRRSIYIYEWII